MDEEDIAAAGGRFSMMEALGRMRGDPFYLAFRDTALAEATFDPSVKSYTLRPTPYALRPTPYALRPTPYTLHPTP
jgi:hypothetical protein